MKQTEILHIKYIYIILNEITFYIINMQHCIFCYKNTYILKLYFPLRSLSHTLLLIFHVIIKKKIQILTFHIPRVSKFLRL